MNKDALALMIQVRPATAKDAEAIFAVHRDSVESLCASDYSAQQIAMWLDGRSPSSYQTAISKNQIVVATIADHLVGFVEATPGEIVKLFIAGAAAGQGGGARLMEAGLAMARDGHDSAIHIESTKNAESFYARYGFKKVGEGVFSRGGSAASIEIVKLSRQK